MTAHTTPGHTPDLPQLSAYLDGELDARAQQRVAAHLATCPVCAARFAQLQALSASFQALPEEPLGFDLAGVIEGRLANTPRRPATPRRFSPLGWWPVAVGAALSITVGLFMGSTLVTASAVTTPRMTAMRVFDPMPPGSLCIGFEACYVKGITP